MASYLPVGERAYRAIKRRLLDAAPAIGTRLDIATLADLTNVSTTPVREALHRLAAERLVENRAGEGFFVPRPGVAELRRLYHWHGQLAVQAAGSGAARAADGAVAETPADGYVATLVALFAAIAASADDAELRAALVSADERLRVFRRGEPLALAGAAEDLAALDRAWWHAETAELRRCLARHVRERCAAAAEILDAAGRSLPDIRDMAGI